MNCNDDKSTEATRNRQECKGLLDKAHKSKVKMTNNSTSGTCIINDDFKYVLYGTIFSLVFVLGLIFNIVTLYIFTYNLKQRNETTIYMVNLAVSDMLFVLSLPFRIFYFINKKWPFGSELCQISVSLFYTNLYGSILFLTCICADRFLAIVYPFASRSLRTKRNAKIACCAIWLFVLSGSFSIGLQMDISDTPGTNNTEVRCFEKYSNKQWKSTLSKVVAFMGVVGFAIPLLINLFCSTRIVMVLRNLTSADHEGQLNRTKALRMIVVHLLIFCFCFIPYNVNLVFYTLVRSETITNCSVQRVVKIFYPIAFCIAVTNCCFDPIIYYFTSETFQNTIKRKSYAAQSSIKHCEVPDTEFNTISYSLIFSFGLASNLMALHRLWLIPRKLTSTAVYMANLAAVDLFFIVSLPLRIYYYYNRTHNSAWSPGRALCQLTFTLKYISLYGGIFFLVCIGVDRYYAVVHPLRQRLRRVRTARMLSAGIWLLVLALSLSLPFLLSAASLTVQPCMLDTSSQKHSAFILVTLGLVQTAFLLPALLLFFSYCSVLRVLSRLALRRKLRHQRTLTVIYWVLGVFLLCFAPYHVNLLGYTLTHIGVWPVCRLAKVTTALHPVVLSLASTNCCLNPLIYYFSSSLVHKEGPGNRGSGSQVRLK
ncbi:hypothetical protein NFI96_017413 [Prochilodus magdalenae]|nr:hypothetical protein NFI96_017413 [Prochilodus magdalenae]